MPSPTQHPVTRRKVFYIPGYDPFPPRRYRELYRSESAAQAAISDYTIAMEAGLEGADFGWRVMADIDGQITRSEIEVLVWSDIVQQSRPNGVLSTYADLFSTARIYLMSGALFRLARLRKGPLLAALYPVVALLVQAVVAFGLGAAFCRVALVMMEQVISQTDAPALSMMAYALGVIIFALTLRWFRDQDGRFFAYYLMHDFAHSAEYKGAYSPELSKRLVAFAAKLDAALDSDADEVLLIGHSSGAHLGVSVLADILRKRQPSNAGPSVSFLSLGHVVPMVSFLPDAHRLRADLRTVSQDPNLTWVDVSAPGDGCCFALCDPVGVSGQNTPEKRNPVVFSAAFTQSLSTAKWKSLRWRFFRLHFQYLCAFDRPKDYDYFQITAGPILLKDRYGNRVSSKSRIDRCVSAYTSTTP